MKYINLLKLYLRFYLGKLTGNTLKVREATNIYNTTISKEEHKEYIKEYTDYIYNKEGKPLPQGMQYGISDSLMNQQSDTPKISKEQMYERTNRKV